MLCRTLELFQILQTTRYLPATERARNKHEIQSLTCLVLDFIWKLCAYQQINEHYSPYQMSLDSDNDAAASTETDLLVCLMTS